MAQEKILRPYSVACRNRHRLLVHKRTANATPQCYAEICLSSREALKNLTCPCATILSNKLKDLGLSNLSIFQGEAEKYASTASEKAQKAGGLFQERIEDVKKT